MAFVLISSMVLGLLDELQFFLQLRLIELLGLSTGLSYSNCSTSQRGDPKEFQVRYLALFPLFSVIGSFEWF